MQNFAQKYTPDRPFSVDRIVQWGECDPAGKVYTTQFLDYVLETVEAFWRIEMGYAFLQLHRKLGLGVPTVSTRLEFQRPLCGGDPFTVELRIKSLGRSTIAYTIRGANAAGETCFTGEHISSMVDDKIFKSVSIPDSLRQPLEAYRQATELPVKETRP